MMASSARWAAAVVFLMLTSACDSDEHVPDGGTAPVDAGTRTDGGVDGGPSEDGGTQEEGLPCELTLGVCAGAKRAKVEGVYEPVCTARSYGTGYEPAETRCDGLDNDCDGVVDPPRWSRVTELAWTQTDSTVSILRAGAGFLVSVAEAPGEVRILRLDSELSLLGSTRVPVVAAAHGGFPYSGLLRTSRGPSLYSIPRGAIEEPARGYLTPLDESGAPSTLEDGGTASVRVFDEPEEGRTARVAVSPDGSRLLFVWDAKTEGEEPRELKAVLTDAEGRVLVGPKTLREFVDSRHAVRPVDVLWLRNGELAVAAQETRAPLEWENVWVKRFDATLEPLGAAWPTRLPVFTYEPMPKLVDLGPVAGGPLESVYLLAREPRDGSGYFTLRIVMDLFGKPATTGLPTQSQGVPWYGTYVVERGFRFAWLSVQTAQDGSCSGRLFSEEFPGDYMERALSPELPLHFTSQWVLMEEVAPRQQGALIMTLRGQQPALEAVRYCVPE